MIRVLTEVTLPPEILGLIFEKLGRVRNIHRIKRTCRAFRDAADRAVQAHRRVCFEEHDEDVVAVAVAADGRVVTASLDKTIKVWRDGVCECTIEAHTDVVTAVAVLPGGARFVSASHDRTVKLWSLRGALERTVVVGDFVTCVAALPDGVHFVVGIHDHVGGVRLYHVDGTLVHTFEGHDEAVRSVAVTPDGQHIISCSDDNLIKVWSVASKSLVSTCGVEDDDDPSTGGHAFGVRAVAAMPDGQRILSGGYDDTVRVWLLNGTLENTFELHTGTVFALVALPDNQHALSASHDNTIKLFNVNDGAVLRTFKHNPRPGPVRSLALLPDGLRFVSCTSSSKTALIAYHGLAA